MPRSALRCVVHIDIHACSCPGVWVPRRDDVFLTVTLFNQVRRTQLTSPVFPLIFHEKFRFDRVFYTCYTPGQLAESLDDMKVLIELVQLSDIYDGGRLLAYFEGNARDFLYPFPSYSPSYGTTDRELLLERSLDFPGISPKLEFSTRTSIESTTIPVIGSPDPLSLGYSVPRRSRSRTRSRSRGRSSSRSRSGMRHQRPTISSITRCRSASPSALRRKMTDLELSDSSDEDLRPPFVVRKVGQDLIGRTPGSRSPIRSSSLSSGKRQKRRMFASPACHLVLCVGRHPDDYSLSYRSPRFAKEANLDSDLYPLHNTYSDSDDAEIAALTTRSPRYYPSLRPRSTSPLLYPSSPLVYPSSLRDRYDERPWSPTRSDIIRSRVDRALSRNRTLDPLDYSYRKDDSLEKLARDFELERYRLRSVTSPDFTNQWKQKALDFESTNYRKEFEDSIKNIYEDIFRSAQS